MFYEDCKGKTKSDLSQSVQTAYYQWRGALSEYNLTLIHLFDQDTGVQDNSFKIIAIERELILEENIVEARLFLKN